MQHIIPVMPPEDTLQIKRLIASGLAENIALVFQICLGKEMQCWQILSLIGHWIPMKRIHRYASIEDAEDLLWSTEVNQVQVEFIEFEYHNFHYDYYLRLDSREVNLKQYYHRKTSERQSLTQIRKSFVQGVYLQQTKVDALCQEKLL